MADQILHNCPINNNPSDSEKIAMGTESTPATNITLANFYTLLMSKLGFFKISNLFSEIFGNSTAMNTARTNLSVPSIADMQIADNLRALKTNVIEKDSTTSYTPTLPYHPLNLQYLTDRKARGTFKMTTPWATSTYTINIGRDMGTSNYHVSLMSKSQYGFRGQYPPSIIDRTSTSFKVAVALENDSILTEPDVEWLLTVY